MESSGFNPTNFLYTGNLRPKYIHKMAKPLFEPHEFICGMSKGFKTVVKVYAYGSSAKFPTASVQFGIYNGSGKAYISLARTDFERLLSHLKEVEAIMSTLWDAEAIKGQKLQAEAEQLEALREMLGQQQAAGQAPMAPEAAVYEDAEDV